MSNLIKRRRVLETFTGKATGLPGSIPQSTLLQEWWRADSGLWQNSGLTTPAVADGDPVGGFVGRFASVAATQATAGKRPTLRLSIIGGKPALQFVAASVQTLKANALVAAFSGTAVPQTHIVVFQTLSVASIQALISIGGVAALDELDYRSNGYRYQQTNNSGTNVQVIKGATDGKPHIFIGVYDGQNISIRVDGNAIGTAPGPGGAMTMTEYSIGVQRGGSVIPFNGYMAEIASYNGALTLSSLQSWETYLARRYSLI